MLWGHSGDGDLLPCSCECSAWNNVIRCSSAYIMWFCILGALRLVFVSLGTQKRCEVSRGEMMKIQEGFIACEHKTEPGLKVESHPWSSSGNHKSGKVCKRDEDGQRYVSRFPFFSSAPRLAVAETGPSVYVCVWSVECGRIESSRRDDACVKPPTWAGGKPSPVQCSLPSLAPRRRTPTRLRGGSIELHCPRKL